PVGRNTFRGEAAVAGLLVGVQWNAVERSLWNGVENLYILEPDVRRRQPALINQVLLVTRINRNGRSRNRPIEPDEVTGSPRRVAGAAQRYFLRPRLNCVRVRADAVRPNFRIGQRRRTRYRRNRKRPRAEGRGADFGRIQNEFVAREQIVRGGCG